MQRKPLAGLLVFVIALVGLVPASVAQDEGGAEVSRDADLAPLIVPSRSRAAGGAAERYGDPGLDNLLQIPSGYLEPNGRTVAGAGESEWRRRFEKARKELTRAQKDLAKTKSELDKVAAGGGSSQWSVAPPGASNAGGPSTSPLSFRLRQELLRHREKLDSAERALKELRIEADLASVPVEWRGDNDTPIPRRLPESPYFN